MTTSAVLKSLDGNHRSERILVHTLYSVEWTSGSSDLNGFSINLAEDPLLDYPSYPVGTEDVGSETDNGTYSYLLFNSVKNWYFDADIYDFFPSHSMFIVDIGSQYYGEYIKKGSFRLDIDGDGDYIQDDSLGNLRLNGTGDILGTIFYDNGLAAIQRDFISGTNSISSTGLSIQQSGVVTTQFSSSLDIYEHTAVCNIKPSEFNRTVNPTAYQTISGSANTYNTYINSGSAYPYITTVGLYNDNNELLVVAKLSSPITRTKYSDQTIIVKFDE